MQIDKAKHPHSLLLFGELAQAHTNTRTHIDALFCVTGCHIFGVSQRAGIPGQQGRDNVNALLVNLLFYPVSGPQSVKGVCLWHMHTMHAHTHSHTHTYFHRPLCLPQPVRLQRLKTNKWHKIPIELAASADKSYVLVWTHLSFLFFDTRFLEPGSMPQWLTGCRMMLCWCLNYAFRGRSPLK